MIQSYSCESEPAGGTNKSCSVKTELPQGTLGHQYDPPKQGVGSERRLGLLVVEKHSLSPELGGGWPKELNSTKQDSSCQLPMLCEYLSSIVWVGIWELLGWQLSGDTEQGEKNHMWVQLSRHPLPPHVAAIL